jgi:hypothetical protein
MKTIYVRIVSVFFGLAAMAAATRAQQIDQISVDIPHDFVVAGKTLPAGTYRVNRANDRDLNELEMTSVENHTGALLLSSEVRSTREDKPSLKFQRIGDQYFLSRIETAEHIFTIPVPANAGTQVVASTPSSPSPSSSSGSN